MKTDRREKNILACFHQIAYFLMFAYDLQTFCEEFRHCLLLKIWLQFDIT